MFFREYVEDVNALYKHHGVGYTGLDNDLWYNESGRIAHSGVGYTGVYDE